MMGVDLDDHPPNFIQMFKGLTETVLNVNIDMFLTKVWPIFWPMLVGSRPMAIVAGVVSYFALLPVLKTVQMRRILRRRR